LFRVNFLAGKKKKNPAYQQKKKDFTIIYIAELLLFLYDVTTDLKFRKTRTKND
jgi:hypothetical protein